jgi:hypothetical protein
MERKMTTLDDRLKHLQDVAEQQSSHYTSSRQLLHQNIVDAYLWWRDAQQQSDYLKLQYDNNGIRYRRRNSNQPNFYPLVRLIWDIDVSTKASTISNWAKALTALDQAYTADSTKFPQARADLINYIDAKGGLKGLRGEKAMTEEELEQEEDLGAAKSERGRPKQTTPAPQSVLEKRKERASTAKALGTAPKLPTAVTNNDGFVVLLGRRNAAGDIEIVSSTYKDEAVTEALWAGSDIDRQSVTPSLRLVAECLEPHSVPAKLEPYRKKFFAPSIIKSTPPAPDPNKPNQKIPKPEYIQQSTRLRIRPKHNDILLSNAASKASLTTHIKPKSLQLTKGEAILRGADRSWIETELLNGQKLDLYTAEPSNGLLHDITGELPKYILKLSSDFGHERKLHFFEAASLQKDSNAQPAARDPSKLKWPWELTAQTQWLKRFDATCIDNWLTHTRGMFNKKQMQRVALAPTSTELTLKHWWLGTGKGYERAHDTVFGNEATATLHKKDPVFECSPKDLAVVFSTLPLMPLTCEQVIIRANENVMQITYSTDLADYESFIPAVTDAGEADATAFKIYGGDDA